MPAARTRPEPPESGRWSSATIEARSLLGSQAEPDAPLGPWCTYRVGGPAAALVRVESDDQLDRIATIVGATGVAVLTIGRGSNLLVADRGFDGLVLVLGSGLAGIDIDGTSVSCGAAALMPVVARASVRAGLQGFEWAVGVPGSIGGGVRMNAGGHGSDMAASLVEAELVDLASGTRSTRRVDRLGLGYRTSDIGADEVVVSARLQLAFAESSTGDPVAAGEARLSEIVRWRREHQPGGANAGSVFANPDGDSAGRLIESVGAKGLQIGSASVSTKHANFIQAEPDGSADDVYDLIQELKRRVLDEAGVELRAENRLIGFEASR